MRKWTAVGALLVGAMVAGGCASPGERPEAGGPAGLDASAGPVPSGSSWESCAAAGAPAPQRTPDGWPGTLPPAEPDQVGVPWLPEDVTPVAVTTCAAGLAVRGDSGADVVPAERRSDDPGGMAALVAALRLPDATEKAEVCTAEAVVLPWFVLHDANGAWVRPRVPFDSCSRPRAEVLDALRALETVPGSETVAGEPGSARTGCADAHADMIAVTGRRGTEASPAAAPPAESAQLRLCVYRVPESEFGSGKPAGALESGTVLTTAAWTAVRSAFPPAGRAAPCTTPSGSFAVLEPLAGGPVTYVELSGCGRTMQDGAGLATGSPALTAAIRTAASQ